jgi:hypothetical protein
MAWSGVGDAQCDLSISSPNALPLTISATDKHLAQGAIFKYDFKDFKNLLA